MNYSELRDYCAARKGMVEDEIERKGLALSRENKARLYGRIDQLDEMLAIIPEGE